MRLSGGGHRPRVPLFGGRYRDPRAESVTIEGVTEREASVGRNLGCPPRNHFADGEPAPYPSGQADPVTKVDEPYPIATPYASYELVPRPSAIGVECSSANSTDGR